MDVDLTTLHKLFESAATLYPDNVAVKFHDEDGEQQLTYSDVSDHVMIVTHHIKQLLSSRHGCNDQLDSNCCSESFLMDTSESFANITGLYLNECCFLPSLVVGVMKAGASFMPISCLSPKSVICNMLLRGRVKFVLTTTSLKEQFLKAVTCPVSVSSLFTLTGANCSDCSFVLLRLHLSNPISNNSEKVWHLKDDLAFVLSTSGTTGDPKMVFVPHKCIMSNILHLCKLFEISSTDVVAMSSPLTFDPSIVEMFIALSSGATLVIVSNSLKCRPFLLAKALFDISKVTVMQCTPTLFNRFTKTVISDKIMGKGSFLRVIAFGGEPCPSCKTMKRWLVSNQTPESGKVNIYNIYGITEVSSWSTIYRLTDEELLSETDGPISLGYPLWNTILDIVDKNNEVLCQVASTLSATDLSKNNRDIKTATNIVFYCPDKWSKLDDSVFVIGHLRLGGINRLCYLNESGLNSTNSCTLTMRQTGDLVKFVVNDKDFEKLDWSEPTVYGVNYSLFHLGRTDSQIKRQGKRVNLLSVKYKLEELEYVIAAHLLNVEFNLTSQISSYNSCFKNFLVAFIVSENQNSQTKPRIYEYLFSSLERHCVPDEILLIDQLPVTSHGKVDDSALRVYLKENCSCSYLIETKNDLQSLLVQCWVTALNHKENGSLNTISSDAFDSNFIESGGNSLGALKLAGNIEKILCNKPEISFDTNEILNVILHKTLNDLLQLIWTDQGSSLYNSNKIETTSKLCNSSKNRKRSYDQSIKKLPSSGIKNDKNDSCYFSIGRGNKSIPEVSSAIGPNKCLLPKFILNSGSFSLTEKWSYNTLKCIDSSPLIVFENLQNGFVLAGSHSHLLVCVHLSTGIPLWTIKLKGRIESSPCLTSCSKYITVGCYDGCVYVLELLTGNIWWRFQTEDQIKSSPCPGPSNSSRVFVGSHDGYLYCIDADAKNLVWKYNDGRPIFSSPCFEKLISKEGWNGVVYGCSLSGSVFSLRADDGMLRWSVSLNKPLFSSPLATDLGLCVGCVDNNIYMLDKNNGQTLWQFATKQPVFSSPALAIYPSPTSPPSKQVIFCGSHDGCVYCLNCEDGGLEWFSPESDKSSLPPIYATPFPATISFQDKVCSIVVCASTDGVLSVFDMNDGKVLLRHKLPGHVFSSPVVIGQEDECKIIVGCRNDFLYCFNLALV